MSSRLEVDSTWVGLVLVEAVGSVACEQQPVAGKTAAYCHAPAGAGSVGFVVVAAAAIATVAPGSCSS